jgi:hypothetical protein
MGAEFQFGEMKKFCRWMVERNVNVLLTTELQHTTDLLSGRRKMGVY